jgi:ABC-type molybdate transport system permease subunit
VSESGVRPTSLNPRGDYAPHVDNYKPETEDRLVRSLVEILQVAEDHNIDIVLETHITTTLDSATTIRRVVLPLLRPAIVASLVYSFVRAMTAVSAVIFLVTAEYNMATAYIVGRVEAGEFGLAIAYSSVLILIMLGVIGLIQLGVGERKLGRRESVATIPAAA